MRSIANQLPYDSAAAELGAAPREDGGTVDYQHEVIVPGGAVRPRAVPEVLDLAGAEVVPVAAPIPDDQREVF